MAEPTHIVVRNARTHNLQGVDLAVPRNALVVFTGVSGSGKSSLVFDTIHQEGQRRFTESLSAYARQFLGQAERPEVDAVEGVSPTLSIDQKTVNRNPRSTVGTITEIYDHLRLLMARLGEPRCPACDTPIARLGVEQLADRLLESAEGRKVVVLGPVIVDRKGEHRKEIEQLARDGWARLRVDGAIVAVDEVPELERYVKHTIEVVVDRLVPAPAQRTRLLEALETALRLGEQTCTVLIDDEVHAFSTRRACPHHPEHAVPKLEPRLFSFNAPQGACPTCNGLGALDAFREDLLFDLRKPVRDCFRAFNADDKLVFSRLDRSTLLLAAKALRVDMTAPLASWSEVDRRRLIDGDPDTLWVTTRAVGGGVEERSEPWPGLLPLVERVWGFTRFPSLEPFRRASPCPGCDGARLNPIARAVVFRGRRLPELSTMSVADAHAFFREVTLSGEELQIGELLVAGLRERLAFLHEVGLDYLTLSRSAATLSGGEAQRIRLASQVGSGLQGVTYVLDEPSIGLHARDNQRLLAALRRLRDRGNSVLVVEHDADTILAADHVVDVGPGAGRLGGHVTDSAAPAALMAGDGLTARWLRGEERMPDPKRRGVGEAALVVRGAHANNLRGLDVAFPVGRLTVVSGVSGSGKSSLVFRALVPSVTAALEGGPPADCDGLEGADAVDRVVHVSQQPIGRSPRSNPATYTGVMDPLRDLFAALPEAKARGYTKSRFSFNVAGGRCDACEGAGVKVIEMQFLPDVEVPCETCGGRRFNAETLQIRWRGLSVADVLELSVADALEVFEKVPKVARVLRTMIDVGLDYLQLGQTSTTLSGGEAQRVKLATELHRPSTGRTLYLLDEPTTGLHFEDVRKLLVAVDHLVEAGNTVVIVEHHLDVLRFADHVIELGPEGGGAGGHLLFEGAPDALAQADTPTGRALAAEAVPVAATPAAPWASSRPDAIVVEGARKHNLQAVDVTIPHGAMTVITGVSGSGKTSLALDTIFAEGQRRYVESLSTYARRFLGRVDRAPVDRLDGLQPAIAIDQGTSSHNPRSTVATVTEIHDVLRLLYARVGDVHCPTCDRRVVGYSPSRGASWLASQAPGMGMILAPLAPSVDAAGERDRLMADGWRRLWHDDVRVDLEGPDAVAALASGCWLVVDRLDPATAERARVSEALGRAYDVGGAARFLGAAVDLPLTPDATCPEHGAVTGELTPRHFSFNSRIGMCPACEGIGTASRVIPERLLVGRGPLEEALDPRALALLGRSPRGWPAMDALLAAHGGDRATPLGSLPTAYVRELLGGRAAPLDIAWQVGSGEKVRKRKERVLWGGMMALLAEVGATWATVEGPCPACGGGRLGPVMQAVRLQGLGIHELAAMTVDDAAAAVAGWQLAGEAAVIAERPVAELRRRLGFLTDVGLGYLTLDRAAESLSGGESQRIRLASQLGAGLTGTTYVLDEPTVGLHPRDTGRLLRTLQGLRDAGNTVVVVEHDPDCIAAADHVIDMGPAAGVHGGRVLAQGTPDVIRADPASITGAWLTGRERFPERGKRPKPSGAVHLRGASGNNLQGVDVTVPLGQWTAVTGVSGSGKSTLIMDTLAPALVVHTGGDGRPLAYTSLVVEGTVDGVVVVDQQPIGRTPRSTPATYTAVMDRLRALYAGTTGAMERGWKAGRFSFNAAGGRCETCEGRGQQLIEMHFLPDVWITCPDCRGRRFARETLEVRFKGLSIADALALRADEARDVFAAQRPLKRELDALCDVGLGYLQLGQAGTTLSGGEAQRVKLARELVAKRGQRVYVLDEPTTGLHLSDVAKLVGVLHRLVKAGHTVITIEHHLDMIRQADHVIELGPDGGAAGGRIVATGAPAAVAKAATATGAALRG